VLPGSRNNRQFTTMITVWPMLFIEQAVSESVFY